MVHLKIKELCKERGVTMVALSEKIGISRTSLTLISNAQQKPSFETIEKIATALGVEVWELFYNGRNSSQSFVCPECGAELKLQITKA